MSFFFTRCQEVCPVATAQLVRAQAEVESAGLAAAVRFVSITVDPAVDTPEVLSAYAARFDADTSTWDFLTGDPDGISRLARRLGVPSAVQERRRGHAGDVLLVSPRGHIVRRFPSPAGLSTAILSELRRPRATRPGTPSSLPAARRAGPQAT